MNWRPARPTSPDPENGNEAFYTAMMLLLEGWGQQRYLLQKINWPRVLCTTEVRFNHLPSQVDLHMMSGGLNGCAGIMAGATGIIPVLKICSLLFFLL